MDTAVGSLIAIQHRLRLSGSASAGWFGPPPSIEVVVSLLVLKQKNRRP
jgi:hypothetical protein